MQKVVVAVALGGYLLHRWAEEEARRKAEEEQQQRLTVMKNLATIAALALGGYLLHREARTRAEEEQQQRQREARRRAEEEQQQRHREARRRAEEEQQQRQCEERLRHGSLQPGSSQVGVVEDAPLGELAPMRRSVEETAAQRERRGQIVRELVEQEEREAQKKANRKRRRSRGKRNKRRQELRQQQDEKTPVPVLDEGLCVICLDREKTHLIVPCGHKCLCAMCGDLVVREGTCPICRGACQEVCKVYD